jgi:hypothetical protein
MQTQFRLRASGLRLTAYGILGLIFLLLVGGASAFVLAPQIASSDLLAGNDVDKKLNELSAERDQLQNQIKAAQDQWDKASESIYAVYRSLFAEYSPESRSSPGVILASPNLTINLTKEGADKQWVLNQIDQADKKIDPYVIWVANPPGVPDSIYSISRDKLDEVKTRIGALNVPVLPIPKSSTDAQDRLQLLKRAISELYVEKNQNAVIALIGRKPSEPNQESQTGAKSDQAALPLAQLLQTNITRFGTIIMITFLVSILTPLYRYNIRLAAYYDARADVLELMKSDLKKVGFIDLAASLTPSLDFGKAPSTPIEQIIELARHIAGDKSKSSEKPE